MSENEEPDWLAELAKRGDTVRGQIELLIQGAQQFVRDGQQATASGGPVPPFQQRVVRAVGVAMRELVPAAGYPVRYGSLRGNGSLVGTVYGTSSLTGSGTLTASGSVTAPMPRVAGQLRVEEHPRGLAALSDGEKAALVLIWLYAVWLPWFGSRLPPELHAMLSDSYGSIAIALAITWQLLEKHK